MEYTIASLVFIFGTVVGSFLNVVILRHGTKQSSVSGRSMCPSCSAVLTWQELIPVVSFFLQRGRCRSCKSKLSWQYPVIELLTAFLFLSVHLKLASSPFSLSYVGTALFYFTVIGLFIVITVYDYYHKIIPNVFVYPLIVLTGIGLFISFPDISFSLPSMWHLLAGPILFLPFALLWLVSRGRWMGFGDAKLAIAIGWLLGLRIGLSAIVLGFWIGALYSIGLLILQRTQRSLSPGREKLTMKSEVPFGPFLVVGTLVGLFFGLDVLSLNYVLTAF